MTDYRPRLIDDTIGSALETFGGIVIEGPRASGKTTTALQHAASAVRIDASPDVATLAEVSPGTILDGATPRLIDEWQLAPRLWNAARHAIDTRQAPGQFLLTGSAVPRDDVTRHSGAGRFRRITMRPMSLLESNDSTGSVAFGDLLSDGSVAGIGGPSVEDYARLITRGGWPALVTAPTRSPTDFLNSYLDNTTRVDVATAGVRADPLRMRALIRAVARNVATEVPVTRLAAEAQLDPGTSVSAQSARKYLDALIRVSVIEEQPAWQPHLRSAIRLRVSPTWHLVDPSLAAAALGASAPGLLHDPRTLGFFFESLAIRDLRIYAETLGGTVSHYRDEQGLEVDAIVDLPDGRWAAFEVKLGGDARIDEAATNLAALANKVSEPRAAQLAGLTVITAGNVSRTRSDGVHVVSLGHLGVG